MCIDSRNRTCESANVEWRILAVFLVVVGPTRAGQLTARQVAARIDELKTNVVAEVTQALETKTLATSYTTVWRDFEDDAIAAMCRAMKQDIPGLSDANFDKGQTGSEKNRLADLAIRVGGQVIEVSLKAARAGQNPENDIGTFREHPERQKIFVASFTLWIRYAEHGGTIKMDRVYFDRTWRFVGKSALLDGVKYRKKDGNLRPKSWALFDSGEAYWQSEDEFEAAVKRSEKYRAASLVQEHLRTMSEEDQRLLYEALKKKFKE